MPKALASAVVGALLALLAAQAMALGIGKVNNQSLLGHPLRFAVELRLDEGESLSQDCIAIEVHAGENRILPSALRWAIEPGSEPTERTLRIASTIVIDEPVVNLNVHFTCPTRLTRRFVALVDPPTVALNGTDAPLLAASVPTMPVEPATAPVLRAVVASQSGPAPAAKAAPSAQPKASARRVATRAGATPRRTVASAAVAPTSRRTGARKGPMSAPVAAAGARLKLEATDHAATRERVDLHLTSGLAPATAPASAALGAAGVIEDPAAQQARERLQALEDNLARLQAEGRAMQAGLTQMQQRLREAEAARYANPFVYALGTLAALLAAALAFVLWKRPGAQAAASPWYAAQQGAQAQPADDWQAPAPDTAPPALRQIDAAAVAETTASPMMISQAATLAAEPSGDGGRAAALDPALAVEELIDLEQQAEFFVVLGQDDAAIDLLMGHLRSSGGASPLPYLKLLEIYRRRGDREAGERIRERFNRRFNAYAPEWQADLQQGRTLADYPTAIARLQELWATPTQALRALEASLLRRDGASSTFDLPAYRELLFLYSVARDLAERDPQPANVDLLLPLGDDAGEAAPMTRLHPTAAPVRIDPPADVDVDITRLDDDPAIGDPRPSRLLTDFSPTSGHMPLAIEPSNTRH